MAATIWIKFLASLKAHESENKNLHPRVRVDQAVSPLPPKTLSILVGLVLKRISMCNHNLKIWKSLDSLICFDYVLISSLKERFSRIC